MDKEEVKIPETFEDKMDFLAKDEQEAIDGYDLIIASLEGEDNVKEQLEKIRTEEIAHKEFLEKVKEDHNLIYTEPLEQEEVETEDSIEEDINYNKALAKGYKALDDAGIQFNVDKSNFEFNDTEDAQQAYKILMKIFGSENVTFGGLDVNVYLEESKSIKEDDWDFMRKVKEIPQKDLMNALKKSVSSKQYKELVKDGAVKIAELRSLGANQKENLLKKLNLSEAVINEKDAEEKKADREERLADKAEKEVDKLNNDFSVENLVDVLIPSSGKADSVAGELLRACTNIDTDEPFNADSSSKDNGNYMAFIHNFFKEQNHQSAKEIVDLIDSVAENFEEYKDEEKYEEFLDDLLNKIADYIKEHQELIEEPNKVNSRTELDGDNYWEAEDAGGTYNLEAQLPESITRLLQSEAMDEDDVVWEVQEIISGLGNSTDDVEVENETIYVKGLSKDDYDELNDNLTRWLDGVADNYSSEE